MRFGAMTGERDDDHIVRARHGQLLQLLPDRRDRRLIIGQQSRFSAKRIRENSVQRGGVPAGAVQPVDALRGITVDSDKESLEHALSRPPPPASRRIGCWPLPVCLFYSASSLLRASASHTYCCGWRACLGRLVHSAAFAGPISSTTHFTCCGKT